MQLVIDPEFRDLIPPLSKDEYAGLESSIKREGCHTPLITWGKTIIDGHNRYEICTQHAKPFDIITKSFECRSEARIWILKNQLSRRNLSDTARIDLALLLKSEIQMKAQERKIEAGKETGKGHPKVVQNSAQPNEIPTNKSRDEVAELAGVSHDTVTKYEKVKEKAEPELLAAVQEGKVSLNAAAKAVDVLAPEKQREIAALPKGEAKKAAVEATRPNRLQESADAIRKAIDVLSKAPEAKEMALVARAWGKEGVEKTICASNWLNNFSEAISTN